MQIEPSEFVLATGEPTVSFALVQGVAHPWDFCPIAEAVTWMATDESVAMIVETGTDDDRSLAYEYDVGHSCPPPYAIVQAVGPGSTEIIATSDFDPDFEDRASITVTSDAKLGSFAMVDGERATTVGATLTVEVEFALYGEPDPQDSAVEWATDDPDPVTTEGPTLHERAPHVFRSTLLLHGVHEGVTTVRATHPLPMWVDYRYYERPSVEIPVTIAPEAGAAFVVVRGGDRTVELGDSLCVEAYVGMPVDEPDVADAVIEWSQTTPGVLRFGGVSVLANDYPFDVYTCMTATGPGVTRLVATSHTWPDASASVSIEVIE